jgi:small neutral amino acid transporter SnatA (MarC family)
MADFTTSTALLEGLAVLAATNPPRVWSALPHPPERVRAAVVGGSVTLAAAIVLAALASGVLDVLDISASTFRLGAGIVIAVVGVYQLLAGAPKPEPALDGWKAGLVPLAFPLLINPALGAAVLAAAADHGVATPIVATLVGAAILVALSMTTEHARVLRGAGRVVAAALVIVGIALAVDGVFSL